MIVPQFDDKQNIALNEVLENLHSKLNVIPKYIFINLDFQFLFMFDLEMSKYIDSINKNIHETMLDIEKRYNITFWYASMNSYEIGLDIQYEDFDIMFWRDLNND